MARWAPAKLMAISSLLFCFQRHVCSFQMNSCQPRTNIYFSRCRSQLGDDGIRRTKRTFAKHLAGLKMVTDSKALERRKCFYQSVRSEKKEIFVSSSLKTVLKSGGNLHDRFEWTDYFSVADRAKESVGSARRVFSSLAAVASSGSTAITTVQEPQVLGGKRELCRSDAISISVADESRKALFQPFSSGSVSYSSDSSRRMSLTTALFPKDDQTSENTSRLDYNSPFATCDGPRIDLTPEEKELFDLLSKVTAETKLQTTLRVAGGWVRDKLLATEEFSRPNGSGTGVVRLTAKHQQGKGRKKKSFFGSNAQVNGKSLVDPDSESSQQPVDIDIALDDMLGREFADHLNEWLSTHGRETVSVGLVLKNPEKSKHLETATMKVNKYWIDFVNLRAEEYSGDSRIPDLMRIGTAEEDAFRRDLTINSLFYNINTGTIEDLTGRGVDDLKRGIIATPLPPLTTLLDDPLRVLRSVRFAARLRFNMDEALRDAARDSGVREALALKVSRERVGGEVDLMLRSLDPVGAMRLLVNLHLVDTVFPLTGNDARLNEDGELYERGLGLLSVTHDHLCDCRLRPPVWCQLKRGENSAARYAVDEQLLVDDEESRRFLWYAAFLKPLRDKAAEVQRCTPNQTARRKGKKSHQSIVMKMMVDDLKRPARDAQEVERIQEAADEFTRLLESGGDLSATAILLSEIRVAFGESNGQVTTICSMPVGAARSPDCLVDPDTEQDPMWLHAMEFRLMCSKILHKIENRWRAALVLSLSEQLFRLSEIEESEYVIEGDVVDQRLRLARERIIAQYDTFAAAMMQLGLVGIWNQKPLLDGSKIKQNDILPNIKNGPAFRVVMDEQMKWMTTHPGGNREALVNHLQNKFHEFAPR